MSKNNTKQKDGRLKEVFTILGILAATGAILCGLMFISQCEYKPDPHDGRVEYSTVTDTETGIKYVECPQGYGPVTVKEIYMECESENGGKLSFYEIAFADPSEFIALKGADAYTVYRAEKCKMPSIEEFAPVSAKLFMSGASFPIDNFFSAEVAAGDESIEDGSVYVKLIADALKGEGVSSATGKWGTKNNYGIWLCSKEYPHLYYKVDFKVDVNGAEYLYDRVTGKLVRAPKELVARIIG